MVKVDLTQLEVDMRYFERNLFWTDVFDGEKDENFKPSIFRERKANFPTKYNPPEALKTFISSFKTDLRDPESRKKNIKPNLSPSEKAALSELQSLQKNRVITIKACDKGSGLMLLDTPDYVNACREHLASSLKLDDGSESPYYRKVDETALDEAKEEITAVLQRAHKAGIISDHELKHMDPSEKAAARFYAQRSCPW